MSVTAGVSDTLIAIRDKLKGKIGQTKVKRYWPGKAPVWADDEDEDGDILMTSASALNKAFPTGEVPGIAKRDDPRLRRLAESKVDNREEARSDHRRIRQAEIVSTKEGENERQEGMDLEEEDEDALEERRRRIREKLLQRQKEEVENLQEEEEEVEVEESEYETDSEDEYTTIAMVKPVFVPKPERDTIAERERIEAEDRALEELMKKRMEEQKDESKKYVADEKKNEDEIQNNIAMEANVVDIDTDDEANAVQEYEAWKARELARLKWDREDRDVIVNEKEEIQRVRNMTTEERRRWEMNNRKPEARKKQKRRFMQKYYHKGSFFQTDGDDQAATAGSDNIFRRDYSAPTGEDKMDKSILPKVMQVKHFGRSGRTKWTHLVNEDTTDWNNPWTSDKRIWNKYQANMAGMYAPTVKPRGSKKMKDWESR